MDGASDGVRSIWNDDISTTWMRLLAGTAVFGASPALADTLREALAAAYTGNPTLEAARAQMNESDLERIIAETRHLKQLQETPDSPEALASLPVLRLEDLDRKNKLIPIAVSNAGGAQVLYHDLFTNGIVSLDLGLNLPGGRAPEFLFLGAHCDDIEIGCAGTLLRWLSEHERVAVTWVVFSAAGERAAEARGSARALLRRGQIRLMHTQALTHDGFHRHARRK